MKYFRILLSIGLIAWLSAFSVYHLNAEIYKWKDADGNWHFSDAPNDIPEDSVRFGEIESPPEPEPPLSPGSESEQPISATANEAGLFWRVEKPGIRPNFLLGTIHVEDPRVLGMLIQVENPLASSKTFIMEAVLDQNALIKMSTAMVYTDGRTLRSVIGEPLFSKVANAAAQYGIGDFALNKMKPWAAFSILSVPKPKTGAFMDMVLYNKAKSQGKSVVGLETPEEQLAVFESMSERDQIILLEEIVNQISDLPTMFDRLIQAYLSGDLNRVTRIATDSMKSFRHQALVKRLMFRLNDQRNRKMVRRVEPYLIQGGAFVAVGALHLPGQSGLLNLLKQKGFRLSALKFP
jgi:hypothetical protein